MKSRHGLEIRGATTQDAAGLAELLAAAGRPVPPRDLAARLEALLAGASAVLIAAEWGPPSGVVVLHWHQTLTAPRPIAQITALLVGPDDRRRGIGRMLLKSASQAARVAGCDVLELMAPPDQIELHEFCKATGFSAGARTFVRALRKSV